MPSIRCPECNRPVPILDDERGSVRCSSCRCEILLGECDAEIGKPRNRKRKKKDRRSVESRVYVHDACEGQTTVSDDEFARVANPFTFVSQTYCASCESFGRLGTFSWADTGENLAAFRRRMRRKAPVSLKLGAWLFGPLLAAAPSALIGYFCSTKQPAVGAAIGAVAGAFFFVAFLTPYVSQWLWGIDYRAKE